MEISPRRNAFFQFLFAPDSNYYAKDEQMYGFVPKGGKTNVTLFRKASLHWIMQLADGSLYCSEKLIQPGKGANEQMKIEFAAVDEAATDPKASFPNGRAMGEFAGETVVTLVPTE